MGFIIGILFVVGLLFWMRNRKVTTKSVVKIGLLVFLSFVTFITMFPEGVFDLTIGRALIIGVLLGSIPMHIKNYRAAKNDEALVIS